MRVKIFGNKIKDIAIAFTDFYTIGHFIFGYITCLVISMIIYLFWGKIAFIGVSITITINIGLIWEFIENFYLYKRGFKFEDRIDSFENSLTDVLFVNIGGIVCGIISTFGPIPLLIGTVLILVFTTALYEILRKITFNKMNTNGKNMEKV